MSISPKNWNDFQHYKDRSPIWIKLHRKLLDDFAFSRLPVDSKALAPLLWLLSSEYDDGKITASIEEIAFRLRMNTQDLVIALKPLLDNGFFIDDSDTLADRYQVAMPEKRERTSKRQRREDSRTIAKATRPTLDKNFEEFKKAYPKRKGGNPWTPARMLFEKALRGGTSLDQILSALRKGIGFDRDKAGTEFVPQAVKWLRDERWRDTSAASSEEFLSDQEREQLFAKLREKPNDQSGERTELREAGTSSREVQGEGREGSAGPPDNRTRNAGMVSLAAVFREPPGVRAGSNEAGSDGNEPADDSPRAMAARF